MRPHPSTGARIGAGAGVGVVGSTGSGVGCAMARRTGAGSGLVAGGAGVVVGAAGGAGRAAASGADVGAATTGSDATSRTSEKRGAAGCKHCGPASVATPSGCGRDAAGPFAKATRSAWQRSAAGAQRRIAWRRALRNWRPPASTWTFDGLSHSWRRRLPPAVGETPHKWFRISLFPAFVPVTLPAHRSIAVSRGLHVAGIFLCVGQEKLIGGE
jgi:hypothetical protein